MIHRLFLTTFFSLIILASANSRAQTPPQLEEAERALKSGDKTQALFLYEQLYSEGFDNALLHYNIGTLLSQVPQLGKAIFHLQRAYRLAPFDENIQYNLQNTQNRLTENAFSKAIKPPLWQQGLQSLTVTNTQGAWFLFVFLVWSWFLWTTLRRTSKGPNKVTLIIFIVIGAALTFVLTLKNELAMQQFASVIHQDVSGQAAPSEKAESAFTVQEGAYGEMLEAQDQYIRLRLENGLEAWFHEKHLYFGNNNAP